MKVYQKIKKFSLLFLFLSNNLVSQNIDMYIALLNEGNSAGVKEQLPELISKFPNDPDVLFLKALLTQDGMSALEQFGSLLDKYPKSKYAPETTVRRPYDLVPTSAVNRLATSFCIIINASSQKWNCSISQKIIGEVIL